MESSIRRIQITSNHIQCDDNSQLTTNNVNAIEQQPTSAATDANASGHIFVVQRPFEPDSLNEFLFPYHRDLRKRLNEQWASNELITRATFGLSLEEERALSMKQLKEMIRIGNQDNNFNIYDFLNEPTRVATWHQCYKLRNIGVSTLFGVHYSLFSCSILFLGTDEQRQKWLPWAQNCEEMGCFALTELGHGSNVQQIETTATYDSAKEEFILNSPTVSSQKYFIGGAASNAHFAVVFAQLRVGEKWEGVHAFIARIREKNGKVCDGVKIADCGHKMALNGVDNGRIMFTNYRVKRDELLSRYGGVNKAGIYSSPINPAIKRFAHNIGALVFGRYIVSLGSVSFASVALATALLYAHSRRQFGEDSNERQLISYAIHRRRLMPHLARNYAVHFGNEYLLKLMSAKENKKEKEIHVYASALKAYGSWHGRDCLQECREACGGQGFLSNNLIGPFKSELEIYTTFEGDNTLLYQQVAKHILTEARRRPPPEYTAPSESSRSKTDRSYLCSDSFIMSALNARVHHTIPTVANCLMQDVASGKPVLDAWNDQGELIQKLGIVFTERFLMDRFIEEVSLCKNDKQKHAMSLLITLMGLEIIEKDPWFSSYGYISVEQREAISLIITSLCLELVPYSVVLAEAFGYDNHTLGPISRDWILENKY